MTTTRITRVLIVFGGCALWAACSKAGGNADSARAADSASKAAATAPPAAPAPAALTDANIAAILDEANASDSAGGNVAATKGTSSDVKSFGRDMMRDHHALRKAGQDLVAKLKLTPTPPAGDTMQTAAQAWQNTLTSLPKGAAFDTAYINHEVTVHQGVLSTLQTAQTAAQDTSLKALITKAIPNIEAHLKHAQSIQGKLAGGAMSADSGKKKGN